MILSRAYKVIPVFIAICVAVGIAALAGCSRQSEPPISIQFGVASQAGIQIDQLSFYLYDPYLILEDGARVRVALDDTKSWQSHEVSLIRLHCEPSEGCGHTFDLIRARVPEGRVVGMAFKIGVPFELNHLNPLTAEPPLNEDSMFWVWRNGHKFLRADLIYNPASDGIVAGQAEEARGNRAATSEARLAGAFHLGSTGCEAGSALRAPQAPCRKPNTLSISFESFDPHMQRLDVNVATFVPKALLNGAEWPNCTGDYTQSSYCENLVRSFGLRPEVGACDGTCEENMLFLVRDRNLGAPSL